MLQFEQYLDQFNNTVDLQDYVVALLVTAILSMVIRIFYIRFGKAVSNRRRFANNFLPLALATMLIITIVKSSIALSLGLVGALSIVRFRAAIKDPEELTYLFLVIGLGLATGANQIMIALISIPAILFLLWIHQVMSGQKVLSKDSSMYINIDTDEQDLGKISNLLSATLSEVELKRMDTAEDRLSLSFVGKADTLDELETVRKSISDLSKSTTFSIVERPDIVL